MTLMSQPKRLSQQYVSTALPPLAREILTTAASLPDLYRREVAIEKAESLLKTMYPEHFTEEQTA